MLVFHQPRGRYERQREPQTNGCSKNKPIEIRRRAAAVKGKEWRRMPRTVFTCILQ